MTDPKNTQNAPATDFPPVLVRRLTPDAVLPVRAHHDDAGVDLAANEDVVLEPGERALVGTGIAIALPAGTVGLVHPRSGLAHRKGLSIVNAPGTVDAGYRGEIKVSLINLDPREPIEIAKGDRIAQLLVQQVELNPFVEVDELDETLRGARGHGSTGVR
ncbi:MAG TPA: dUTP diphosphatase [Actinomycetales bacterium]|uniref:dUTP diphosphatase n=1 Tax=uncultured Corynebacterium sp. TaxID=159447 RepID=UPI0017741E13|nr:dUTP diphosphatase [uncultured Corynebacterium sp.]HHU45643.1 dUTP diphosphatase [Actinomycetales bacterium]